jgi:hypothetical protein
LTKGSKDTVRIVVRLIVGVATSAVALLIANVVLRRLTISAAAFPVVVLIFTAVRLILRPAFEATIERHAQLLGHFVGLLVAFASLLITDLVSDGLRIRGLVTWALASLIVWLGGIASDLLLGRWLARRLTGRSVKPA